ncbi:hypothetical protein EJ05DRAFT_534486 [Pseudovirgaria hyperparasitica]|uniref:Uncharacterized protein n=1 Tax=Pseudovirgaria hyperparasitica TaxID=470096 RepID=A0A6A6WLH6_9PEZI|nr:uncharacterized protein EJ05DRAFT_534486 [Pseudovirgaria hyperparasitica]KAF2763064.1 hypothetical protein EJ05DRAFT_534486 [Pseudovirgaria hyperparasitica]
MQICRISDFTCPQLGGGACHSLRITSTYPQQQQQQQQRQQHTERHTKDTNKPTRHTYQHRASVHTPPHPIKITITITSPVQSSTVQHSHAIATAKGCATIHSGGEGFRAKWSPLFQVVWLLEYDRREWGWGIDCGGMDGWMDGWMDGMDERRTGRAQAVCSPTRSTENGRARGEMSYSSPSHRGKSPILARGGEGGDTRRRIRLDVKEEGENLESIDSRERNKRQKDRVERETERVCTTWYAGRYSILKRRVRNMNNIANGKSKRREVYGQGESEQTAVRRKDAK